MAERNYMSDPRCASVEGIIAALNILARYLPNGMQTKYFLEGSHDLVSSYVEASLTTAEDAEALEAGACTHKEAPDERALHMHTLWMGWTTDAPNTQPL